MKMRELTSTEIDTLANRKGVKKHVVANFLSSMGDDSMAAGMNLSQDARSYKWDAKTTKAIRDGISLAQKPAPKTKGDMIRSHCESSEIPVVEIKASKLTEDELAGPITEKPAANGNLDPDGMARIIAWIDGI